MDKIENIYKKDKQVNLDFCAVLAEALFWWPGSYGGGVPPDPIPNSAVKILSADGTAS